jgi:hypothetical protein
MGNSLPRDKITQDFLLVCQECEHLTSTISPSPHHPRLSNLPRGCSAKDRLNRSVGWSGALLIKRVRFGTWMEIRFADSVLSLRF